MSYFNRLKNFYLTGTTSANTDESMRTKKENPWGEDYIFPFGFVQKGIYFQAMHREGFQFNEDEATQQDDASSDMAPTLVKAVKVGNTKIVEVLNTSDDRLIVRGGIIGRGGNVTWNLMVTLCAFDVGSIDISALPSGEVGISWFNANDNNAYLGLVTIDNDGLVKVVSTISLGQARDYGTSLAGFSKDSIGVCFTDTNSDCVIKLVGRDDTGLTEIIDTQIFDQMGYYFSLANYKPNLLVVAYQASLDPDDPVCSNTFYSDGVTINVGNKQNLAYHAYAATSINCISKGDGTIVVGWIDNSLAHIRAAITDNGDRDLEWGDEAHLSASNTAYLTMDYLTNNKVVAAYENTSKSNYLYVTRITISGNTVTVASYSDPGVEAESIYCNVVAMNSTDILLLYADAGNSNYLTEQPGVWKNNLIDIRSTTASISFAGYILSKREVSLGKFQSKKITGTTHASANTQMATQPVLPWNNCREAVILFKDKGCYVYNNGTTRRKSGVSLSGRTIDIRSTSTSVAFEAYVLRVANDPMAISVAQA
jgi:hypothetical protein